MFVLVGIFVGVDVEVNMLVVDGTFVLVLIRVCNVDGVKVYVGVLKVGAAATLPPFSMVVSVEVVAELETITGTLYERPVARDTAF